MNNFEYDLVTDDGHHVMTIQSSFTNLDREMYFHKYIRNMLPALSETEGEPVMWDVRYNARELG